MWLVKEQRECRVEESLQLDQGYGNFLCTGVTIKCHQYSLIGKQVFTIRKGINDTKENRYNKHRAK